MTNNFNSLPNEIMKSIFQYLIKSRPYYSEEESQDEEYLKTCLFVCKSWRRVAQGLIESKITITLSSKSSLERLSGDISYFGSKVKCIILCDFQPEEHHTRFFLFRKILLECTSLESILFMTKNSTDEYLSRIVYGTKKLPSIQKIEIFQLQLCDKQTRELYLHANLQYHETITNLSLASLKDLSRFEDFDDLFQFMAYFPNLVSFRLSTIDFSSDLTIDIHQLFKTAPQLQDIDLVGLKEVIYNSVDEETEKVLQNKIFKNLQIETACMDIKALKYIAKGLEKCKNAILYINIGSLVSDVLLSENDMIQLKNDLKVWTTSLVYADIRYGHNGDFDYVYN